MAKLIDAITEAPDCSVCGMKMIPIFFTEFEEIKGVETGRYRRACSHFECPECHSSQTVDGYFDEPWEY